MKHQINPGHGQLVLIPDLQLWILIAEPVGPEGLINWPQQDPQQLLLEREYLY